MNVNGLTEIIISRGNEVATNPIRKRDNVSKEFRRKLRELIRNQTDVSKKTGIAQTAISEIINGNRNPSFAQAAKIAAAIGVCLDYLADDEMKTPPEAVGRSEVEERVVALARQIGSMDAIVILDNVLSIGVARAKIRLTDPSESGPDHTKGRPFVPR